MAHLGYWSSASILKAAVQLECLVSEIRYLAKNRTIVEVNLSLATVSNRTGGFRHRNINMSCPFKGNQKVRPFEGLMSALEEESQEGTMRINLTSLWKDPDSGMLYSDYLLLDQLLSCQKPITRTKFTLHRQTEVHDEHLFIITHQTYELWFKQIIFELDSVRELLNNDQVDEANMLKISSRLDRIKKIFAILVEQFSILETMTPLDFMDFRDYLAPASGFQSYQFRLIENKLGIKNENRFNYKPNQDNQPYLEVFKDRQCIESIKKSEREPSLFGLIQRWLERTPGLEKDGFDFLSKYGDAVNKMLDDEMDVIDEGAKQIQRLKAAGKIESGDIERAEGQLKTMRDEIGKKKLLYLPILDQEEYMKRNQFRFSHSAMQGALMISLYRDEPRFNQPYQLLVTLMDIDSLLTKWRQNHAQMVLRMIGSDTLGTGGSSGYQYLRATQTPRYNVFLDLFNLSTYLLPKERIPELTPIMRRRLSTIDE